MSDLYRGGAGVGNESFSIQAAIDALPVERRAPVGELLALLIAAQKLDPQVRELIHRASVEGTARTKEMMHSVNLDKALAVLLLEKLSIDQVRRCAPENLIGLTPEQIGYAQGDGALKTCDDAIACLLHNDAAAIKLYAICVVTERLFRGLEELLFDKVAVAAGHADAPKQ